MANSNLPFGFQQYFGSAGAAPTFAHKERRIISSNATAIFFGDPVAPAISPATGYIAQAAAGTTMLAGIFQECSYLSVAFQRRVWNNYWPGSDATGDVIAWVVDDPQSQWRVMGNVTTFSITGTLSTWTQAPVGQYAQFAISPGNTTSHQSGAYLNTLGTTVTFPFIVVDLVTSPPGASGADPTTAYNHVIVGFNNAWMRTNGGGPTGIS